MSRKLLGKTPSKATRFNYDTHDNTPLSPLCLPNVKQFLQLVGKTL